MKKTVLFLISAALVLWVANAYAQNNNAGATQATIHIRDYCDPDSFNAALQSSDACVRSTDAGAITFPAFLAEVGADKSVGAWRYAPAQLDVGQGATLDVQNLGGETHTFTEVKRFGGGFVAPLNAASGNPIPAPECAQMVDGNLVPQPPSEDNLFIPAGGSATVTLEHEKVARYQCCIHPWMRLTITPRDQHHEQVH